MGDPVDPVDRALLDLDESMNEEVDARPAAADPGVNDRTIAGLGIGTPQPMPAAAIPRSSPVPINPLAHLQPRVRRPTHEPQQELAHPEQSPLSFVMRASESSSGRQKVDSHDMSMFVDGLVADTSPVVEREPAATAMEPVMRAARKRRHWLIASAIAATAIVGTVFGMQVAASEDPPKSAAHEMPAPEAQPAAEVEPPSPPPTTAQTTTVPTPAAPAVPVDEVVPALADTPPPAAEVEPPPAPTVAAISKTTSTTRSVTKTATKTTAKQSAPKKVATANATAKSSAKKPSSAKSVIAKKTTAKKPTPAKKPTLAKKPTPAKKPATSTTAKKTRR